MAPTVRGNAVPGVQISTRIQNTSIQKSNILKIQKMQKSQDPKIQNFLHLRNLTIVFWICEFLAFWIFGFLDFWIFGFLDFWVLVFWSFGFLCFKLVFSICRNSSKIGFGKNGVCIGIYSVFKGCACRRGGDHIHVYIHLAVDVEVDADVDTHIRINEYVYVYIYTEY